MKNEISTYSKAIKFEYSICTVYQLTLTEDLVVKNTFSA